MHVHENLLVKFNVAITYNFLVQAMQQESKGNTKAAKHLAGWSLGCSIFSITVIVIAPIIIIAVIATI